MVCKAQKIRHLYSESYDEEFRLKTNRPLILTARIADRDLELFDQLRTAHFPPDRNFLRAHLTMFHRLPGEYEGQILDSLVDTAGEIDTIMADVIGLRHIGAGVAFSITSTALHEVRERLKSNFLSWLGPQDRQKWQPHITVQNKAPKAKADALYRDLSESFLPYAIEIEGLDLWEYLGGPWLHLAYKPFNIIAASKRRVV